MRFVRLSFLLLSIWSIGCVTPIEERRWIRVETPHFQLISGAGQKESVQIAQRLELFRAVLGEVGLDTNLEPRVPLLVYVFRDSAGFARFRPSPGISSFMLPRTERNFLVIHAGKDADTRATVLHEYVHFIHRNGAALQYPAWYDEGLAEFLSTVAVEDGQIVIGRIPARRKKWLRYGSSVSVRRVMTADDAYEWSDRARARFYAQSWALAHYFHVADQVGFPKRHEQLVRYIALLNHGLGPEEACRKAFETDFEGIEAEFMSYLGKGELPYLGFGRDRLQVAEEAQVLSLPEHERQMLLGDLALALGAGWRDEAEFWFGLAVKSDAEDGRAQAALARVARDRNAADARFARALRLADGDPEVHRLQGEALLEWATAGGADAARELVERSRRSFRRSLSLAPEQVAAYVGLGRSFLVAPELGEPQEGLEALAMAYEKLPADRSISLLRAQLELAFGSIERARELLSRMLPPSHGDPVMTTERFAIREARHAAALPTRAPRSTQHMETRLELDSPREGETVRGLSGWVEALGRGGLWESTLHDVIIAIDESPSTFLPSGTDLDGDGEVGVERISGRISRGRGLNRSSTDPEDTVLRAEVQAAWALIRQLDPKTTRVGIVTFASEANVLAPLGTPESALAWLAGYQIEAVPDGTSLAKALEGALEMFFDYREVDIRRQRTILLLSDGQPTMPTMALGKRDALDFADQLGEIGVPVQAFALGKIAKEESGFYRELAERTGGRFVPLEHPADVVNELANIRFTGLEDVTIRSTPAGKSGRAVRVFLNGSFDGYVPLVEGENVITITAHVEGGKTLSATRTVFFERPANASAEEVREAARFRANLQNRTVELELLTEIRGHASAGNRHIFMRIEEADREVQAP
jgi:tetratricopeptide (TPR) repeat protein